MGKKIWGCHPSGLSKNELLNRITPFQGSGIGFESKYTGIRSNGSRSLRLRFDRDKNPPFTVSRKLFREWDLLLGFRGSPFQDLGVLGT